MKYDIVYVLRNDIDNTDELRYSLRSLVNFPHEKVWFFGGDPAGFRPDGKVPCEQRGVSVWQKTRWTIEQICKTPEVSENFWLFNDDFFIMHNVEAPADAYYDRTLYQRNAEIRKNRLGGWSLYTVQLEQLRAALLDDKRKTYNYETHIPMLINKEKMLKVTRLYPRVALVRSIYGNYYNVGGLQMKDCKISTPNIEPSPDAVFLSTDEVSFASGKVGEYIRSQFNEPSIYEIIDD